MNKLTPQNDLRHVLRGICGKSMWIELVSYGLAGSLCLSLSARKAHALPRRFCSLRHRTLSVQRLVTSTGQLRCMHDPFRSAATIFGPLSAVQSEQELLPASHLPSDSSSSSKSISVVHPQCSLQAPHVKHIATSRQPHAGSNQAIVSSRQS